MGEQHRAVRLERGDRIRDGRHWRIIDLDVLQGVLGPVPVLGDHHRDGLPDVVHHVVGENRQPLLGEDTRGGGAEDVVGSGQRWNRQARQPQIPGHVDAEHAGHPFGHRGVDAHDPRVRLGGPGEHDVVGACGVVGDEPPAAAEQALVLTAPHRAADVARGCRVGAQWIRFSHCQSAIEIANEMVISSMIVATMDG